jgi:two-component system sensor histidine kinase PilS (NtrC family)
VRRSHNLNPSLDRTDRDPALSWRVLAILNLYRVLVPLVLVGLYSLGGARGFAVYSAQLFFGAAVFYLCFGLASVLLVRRKLASANIQTVLQAAVDMLALILLLHACGGVASGLGVLFLVPVGALAFLLPTRSALFLAAVAAIAILVDTISQQLGGITDINSYATAGLLGVVLFSTAAAASFAAIRMRESEALVRQKDVDLANLAELSEYIVQHLRESLLVVDAADKIRLKFWATIMQSRERWSAKYLPACCTHCPLGASASKAITLRRASWRRTARV